MTVIKFLTLLICFSFLVLCGIIFAQKTKDIEYPDTEPFLRFWRKLRLYSSNGKIDLNKNYTIKINADFPDKKISEGDVEFEINEYSPEMKELLDDFLNAADESRLLKVIALEGLDEKINGAVLNIRFDEDIADFKLSLKSNSENTAKKIASRFNLILKLTAQFVADGPEEEFYKNATVSSERNEIFVNSTISRRNLVNYIRYGSMLEETKLTKEKSCYVIVFAEPFVKKEIDKIYLPKFQLLDICPERKTGLAYQETKITVRRDGKDFETGFNVLRTFENKAEAKEFADRHGVIDESMLLNDPPKCKLIRVIDMPLRKKSDKEIKPTIALLDVCLPREANDFQHPMITFQENGKTVTRIFEVIRTFTDQEEAEKYAKENRITDVEFNIETEK